MATFYNCVECGKEFLTDEHLIDSIESGDPPHWAQMCERCESEVQQREAWETEKYAYYCARVARYDP